MHAEAEGQGGFISTYSLNQPVLVAYNGQQCMLRQFEMGRNTC